MTPGFPGRPRSLEPAVVLALAGVVSRGCRFFSFGTDAWHSSQPVTVVLMNAHLETLGVHCRSSPFAAASSTSTRRGRVREGVARKPTTAPTTLPASARASQACAAFSRDGRTTRCRRSRRCTTTQQLGPTSSAPMPSGQTSSLLPHHATSQAQSLCITAAAWRWSSAKSWQRTHTCMTFIRDARAWGARSRGCARGGAHSFPEALLSTLHRTVTDCDAYPAPVPYEKSLTSARHDTGPGKDICWCECTAKETGSRHGQPPHHSTLSVHSQLHVLRPIADKAIPSPMRCSPSRSSTATLVTMEGYPLTRLLSRAFKSNSDLCGVISRMSLSGFFSHVSKNIQVMGCPGFPCMFKQFFIWTHQ